MNTTTSRPSSASLTAAIFSLMIVYGISFTMIGPLMPLLLEHYGLSLAGGGSIVSIQNLSGLIAVVLCGLFGDRLDKNLFVALGVLLFALALIGAGTAPVFFLLMVLFFFLGLGSRGFDTLVNAVISDIHGERRSLFLNLLHTFFGIGAFLGPIFVYVVERSGTNWRSAFLLVGIAAAAVFILFLLILAGGRRRPADVGTVSTAETPDVNVPTAAGPSVGAGIISLFGRWRMWILGVIIFIHMGMLGIIITWMPLYVGKSTDAGGFLSGFSLSAFWIGIIISRALVSRLSLRYGEVFMMRWGALVSALIIGGALFTGNAVVIMIGSMLTGVTIGFTIPFIMAVGCHWYPEKSAAVTSMMFIFGYLSVVVFPWASGLLGDARGLLATMILVPVSQLATFLVSLLLPVRE